MKQEETRTYFALGEHWIEYPCYVGYRPSDGKNWHTIKENFSYDHPQYMEVTNGDCTMGVYVYGFRIPEAPLAIGLGSDATIGRVVLCKKITNHEFIAIHY